MGLIDAYKAWNAAQTALNVEMKNVPLNADQTAINIEMIKASTLSGVATAGATNMLVDLSKQFDTDIYAGKTLRFTLGGFEFVKQILSCYGSQIFFSDTVPPTAAYTTVGDGIESNGSVIISCKGALMGTPGNEYTLAVVQTANDTGENSIAIDYDTKCLTVSVDSNGLGEPRVLTAADLINLVNTDLFVAGVFQAGDLFTPGSIPVGTYSFAGGDDGMPVVEGTEYVIESTSIVQDVQLTGCIVQEQKTQADAVANVITFSENISSIEIYHSEATPQAFIVNGLTLTIADGGWRSAIGGTPAKTVTIPAGITCIVSRLV